MKLEISTRDTDGMAMEFQEWVEKTHPEIETSVVNDGPRTVLIDEDGEIVPDDLWAEFCND